MLTTQSGNPFHGDACVPGSCRDKGRGGVDEGAWCLSWLGGDLGAPRSPHWLALPPDKHQAPTLPHIRPLSLQDPIRSSQFIRKGISPARIVFILELIPNIILQLTLPPGCLYSTIRGSKKK